jgi:hypothetical protein
MSLPHRSHFSPVSRREFLGRLSLGAAGVTLTRPAGAVPAERKLGLVPKPEKKPLVKPWPAG